MRRFAMFVFVTLLGLPGVASGAPTVFGNVRTSFNFGEPVVESDGFAGQSYAFQAARDRGPRGDGTLAILGAAVLYAPGGKPALQVWASDEADFNTGVVRQAERDLTQILEAEENRELAAAARFLYAGDTLVVAGNETKGAGAYQPWIYAFGVPKGGDPLALRATLDLAPGVAASAEVTDAEFAKLPTRTDGIGASYYASVARKIGGADCYELSLTRFTSDLDELTDTQLFNSNFYVTGFTHPFTECHTRATKIATMSIERSRGEVDPVVWMGSRCLDGMSMKESICLYQIKDLGTSASLDTRFGGDGQVKISHAGGMNMRLSDVVSYKDGLVVAAGRERTPGAYDAILIGLTPGGALDTSFGVIGVVEFALSGLSSEIRKITSDRQGGIQVTGNTFTANSSWPFFYGLPPLAPAPNGAKTYDPVLVEHQFADHPNAMFFGHERRPDGSLVAVGAAFGTYPDTSTMRPLVAVLEGPPAATQAIEYFHAGFGHYAIISDPAEIQALDTGVFAGWARTGHGFNVYATEVPGSQVVDRFFSASFAPKSSHFYTREAFESAIVQGNPDWQYEGPRFYALWPNAADGRCPAGTRPVKRIYNNGVTNAPNHRYGDDDAVVDAALAAGGVIENGAADGGYFCTE